MAGIGKLNDVVNWLVQHPEVARRCGELCMGVEDEIHAAAHEVLDQIGTAPPCELLHVVLAGFFGIGYAARERELVGHGDESDEPESERGSSGPAMTPDDLRRLFEQ
jgi:hypothetical protein